METFWIILSIVALFVGFAGSFLPVLPGPPLAYTALLIARYALEAPITDNILIWYFVLVLVVTLLDYLLPIWAVKFSGGSVYGSRGSAVGLILGLLFFPPLGIIIGPFIGALAGEIIAGKDGITAMKSGIYSFLGFLGGTIVKMVLCVLMAYHFIAAVWENPFLIR